MTQTNSIIIHGNLTHEPKIQTFNGRSFCSFQIASTRSWAGQDGEEKSYTDFLPVTAWGKIADSITEQEISKGALIAIEGNLRSSRYEKDGEQRSHIFISARSINNVLLKKSQETPTPIAPPVEEINPDDLPW